jgi:hypothetical protein
MTQAAAVIDSAVAETSFFRAAKREVRHESPVTATTNRGTGSWSKRIAS